MKLVSPFLKSVVYPSLAGTGYLRRRSDSGLAVVTYHGVLPRGYECVDSALDGNLVTVEVLQQQIRLLKSRYSIVEPEEVLAWSQGKRQLPSRAVLLTCDDGLLNNLTDMLPVLLQERVKFLFFVTGAPAEPGLRPLWYEELFLIFSRVPDGPFSVCCEDVLIRGEMGSRQQRHALWWSSVKELSQLCESRRRSFLENAWKTLGVETEELTLSSARGRRFALLNSAQLRELTAAGMTIGAHTLSHPLLSQMTPELARAEIEECREQLESALKVPVWAFAYPFGDPQSVTPKVLEMTKEAGYKAAFLNYGGGLGTALPAHALPRIHVTATMKLSELEAHVSGFYARMQKRVGRTA